MSEILNRREQIKAAAIPPEIADASTLVTKTDYATASKAGVVKVGNNISVASGKISVPDASDEVAGVVKVGIGLEVDAETGALNVTGGGGGGFSVDKIYDGDGSNITFTFPTGKTIADYNFIVLAVDYNGQSAYDCITAIIPVPIIVARTSVMAYLWANASWHSEYSVSATGATRVTSQGSYVVNKVYAF